MHKLGAPILDFSMSSRQWPVTLNWLFALSLGAGCVPHLQLNNGGRTESIALSPGERVSRSGASTSRSGTGEGSLAQFREPTSSVAPRSSPAVQSNSTPQPGFAGETGANLYLQRPVAQGGRCRVLSFGLVAPQGAGRTGRGRLELMLRFSWTRWVANGRNPSPVRRRLEKAPSPDTLSPRERAIFPTWAPAVCSQRCGTCSAPGRGL
jgi:hypothetical protein